MNRIVNRSQRLDHARLVIHLLDRDQRVRRMAQRADLDQPVRSDRQHGCARHMAHHRIMLDRGNGTAGRMAAGQRDLQRLARPAGENHLAAPAQRRLDACARIFQRRLGRAARTVRARRIGIQRQPFQHRVARLWQKGGAGGVVEIDRGQDRPRLLGCRVVRRIGTALQHKIALLRVLSI